MVRINEMHQMRQRLHRKSRFQIPSLHASRITTHHDGLDSLLRTTAQTAFLTMISLMSKQWIYVVILGAIVGCCNGFTRPLSTHHSFARPSPCHDNRQRRNGTTKLQLSSDGKSNQDFWEQQKALAQEMSETADMSLKE
jgi:hypothetical protein